MAYPNYKKNFFEEALDEENPMLCNKRSHRREKAMHHSEE
ncbi:hypothetical protein J1605_000750 [Eschrichtius robustus]|uniref:Uncharacterized protein n=1 Tax=Eschrichtius robustus TaxID=9764 RepID=A0AB34GJQ0_ESCRO|nr:hypothetical protein J1605_000750 [Eschrichtius robustus]